MDAAITAVNACPGEKPWAHDLHNCLKNFIIGKATNIFRNIREKSQNDWLTMNVS